MNEIKEIEEMAREFCPIVCPNQCNHRCANVGNCQELKEACIKIRDLGYRQVKDKVVLTMKEYARLRNLEINYEAMYEHYRELELKNNELKSKVVLDKEEYEKIKQYEKKVRSGVCFTQKEWFDYINEDSNHTTSLLAQTRKETAREIIEMLAPPCEVCDKNWRKGCLCLRAKLAEKIAEEYGVEVKE